MIEFYNLSFRELLTKPDRAFSDPHNIASSLCRSMKEALLHNPSGFRDDEVCQILAIDNDVVVGCTNPYSGRVKIDDKVIPVQNGSYLFSHEDYRKDNIGGDLFLRITNLHPDRNCFFSGISHMAMGMYRALKYTVFEFPRMIYLRRSKSVVQALLETDSFVTQPIVWVCDGMLWLHRSVLRLLTSIKYGGYAIEECHDVSQEVVDIIDSDPHPFAEVHDKAWIEWNLNYKFTEEPRLKKLFVIKRNGKIEAFFITKEQFYEQASSRGFRNVTLGSVMEWGISQQSKLTEKKLYIMSINYFSKNVDGIQFATSDKHLASELKRYLFVGIGEANLGIRFRLIKDKRLKEINNWRIRLAASDTLMN